MSCWTNAIFLVESLDWRNAMTAFLWEFTKVYLAMTCLVRLKKWHSGGVCGYNCPKFSIEPPGGLII